MLGRLVSSLSCQYCLQRILTTSHFFTFALSNCYVYSYLIPPRYNKISFWTLEIKCFLFFPISFGSKNSLSSRLAAKRHHMYKITFYWSKLRNSFKAKHFQSSSFFIFFLILFLYSPPQNLFFLILLSVLVSLCPIYLIFPRSKHIDS